MDSLVCMVVNEELAEFVGAFVGDGCLSSYKRSNRKGNIEEIQFTGSWEKDSPYYLAIIQPIVMENFNARGNIKHRKDDNTVRFRITDKKVIAFLRDLGFNFGPKAQTVKIPDKILNDSSLHKSFLRGFFNTDGTIYKRYSKQYKKHAKFYQNYKVVQFKCASKGLMVQVHSILKELGFNPNRVIRTKDCWVCRVTFQKDVTNFGKEIITNHAYHRDRFLS